MAQSCLSYTQTLAGGAAFATAFTGTIASIQQLSLYTRSGIFLAEIQDFQYYVNVTFSTDTSIEEFLLNQSNLFYRNNTTTLLKT